MNPRQEYEQRLAARRSVAERGRLLYRRIGNARLLTGIAGVILAFFVFGPVVVSMGWLVVPLAAFLALVAAHSRVVERLERAERAVAYYEQRLARLDNRWAGHGESGERYRNPAHVYAEDLDLFGKGSLFELLSTARTRAGEDILAGWLLSPADPDEAAERQAAVQELAPKLDLREDLAVLGEAARAGMDPAAVAGWATAPAVGFPAGARWIALILALAVAVTFGLYMAQATKRTPFLIALFLELSYGFLLGSRTLQVTNAVNSPARELALLARMLERLERERFESALLQRLRSKLSGGQARASAEIEHLRRLVARMDWARNMLFAPIALATLWSAQVAIAVERWRARRGVYLPVWMQSAGEFEAVAALASYCYEHPHDTFPQLEDRPEGRLEAEGLRHPLMTEEQCVPNDVRLGGELRLLIVSGSNMSGKSTLLRSVGLNVVLAWAGAPVRARRLIVSPLSVGASIRVMDSLQDGKSRFYAEITRLREIVQLARGERTVLFLLDELLSGTNSHDRRIGAGAIVRSLVNQGALGLITTHDLALAHIAGDLEGRAANVHFADTLLDGKLHFDYRLSAGVVERSNALDLMRSVGLDV